jgi:hypothetical protein
LNKINADLSLLPEAFKEAITKAVRPDKKEEVAHCLVEEHQGSECAVYKVSCLPRATYRCRLELKHDETIILELTQLVDIHPSIGFWMSY